MQPPSGRDQARWDAKPRLAAVLRVVATVGPMVVAVLVVLAISHIVDRPSGWLPLAGWWVGLSLVSTAVVSVTERAFRRFLPLVALFRLSLVFPDHAPSRFKVAMRTNTFRHLQRNLASGDLSSLSTGLQESAEVLVALVGELNAHDRMTRGHTERVRAYTLMIGEELGLPPDDLDKLHWAGLVHDIGKLEVPPAILNKAGRPSEEEWRILQQHPAAGLRLVEPLRPWLGEWADAASQHHERVDGRGYPAGLVGSEISLSGRIVAVADAYDVMTSVRSYKKAMAPEAARAELGRCAGTQFDREVVRAFLNISVGKLRLVMGPLSSLAQLLRIADVPIGGAVTTGLSTAASVGLAVLGGLVGGTQAPSPTELAFADPPPAASARPAPERAPSTGAATASTTSAPDTTEPDGDVQSAAAPDSAAPVRPSDAEVPVATTLRLTTEEESALDIDPGRVLNPSPDRFRIVEVPPAIGVEAAGQRTRLVPEPDHDGTTSGRYEACWDENCSEATILVTVTPVNDAPVAVPDVVAATSGIPIVVNPLANDTDVEGDELAIAAVGSPSIGRATVDDRRITFTAPVGAAGDAVFTYTAVDPSGATSTAAVVIHVVSALGPDAVDDTALVAEDSAPAFLDVIDNDSAGTVALAGATMRIVGGPNRGTAAMSGQQIVYQPANDASGPDAVDYEICDVLGLCDTATLVIDVVAVNDPPTFAGSGGRMVAEDSGPVIVAGWATAITPGPADETGQAVTFDVAADHPELFSVQPVIDPAGDLTFEVAPDAFGVTSVTVVARDDGGTAWDGVAETAPITFTLTVSAVNDPVVAVDDRLELAEDDPAATVDVLANDSDVDGDPLVVMSYDAASVTGGVLTDLGSGRFSFLPDPDANGTASFSYVAADGHGSTETGTVELVVSAVPDVPQAQDDTYTTDMDTALVPADGLLDNDSDVDGDTLTVVTTPSVPPSHGAVVLAADGGFTYTPDVGFVGTDQFTYEVDDGTGRRATAVATVVVDTSVVTSGLYLGTTRAGSLWNMRTSPLPTSSPEPDHDGDDEPGFTIQHDDNDPEDLDPDTNLGFTYPVTGNTLRLHGPVNLDLWSSAKDFDPGEAVHPLATLYDCPELGGGCTSLASADSLIDPYNANIADWVLRRLTFGDVTHDVPVGHSLVVRVQAGLEDLWVAASGTRPSRLEFTEINAAPTAASDTQSLLEDAATVRLDVLANDTDTNLDASSVTILTPPTRGTAVVVADGAIEYTPTADANGADSLVYRVCDKVGLCDDATVSLTVTAVNDRPSFTGGGDVLSILGAPYSAAWATGTPGPADESGQALTYTVTTDNPSLFVVQPAISPTGILTFRCGFLSIGSANVTVTVRDSGGTANGGADTSTSRTFVISSI